MTSITLDQTIISQLTTGLDVVEVKDESGRVVGFFQPVFGPETIEGYDCPVSQEEIDRRSREFTGRPLEDILFDLQKRQ